jgi:hypothetical protein
VVGSTARFSAKISIQRAHALLAGVSCGGEQSVGADARGRKRGWQNGRARARTATWIAWARACSCADMRMRRGGGL